MTIGVLNGPPDIAGVPGGRIPRQYEPRSLIPGGVKLHGGNITVRPGHATLAWQEAFNEWDWDGTLHPPYPGIKAQVDRAKSYGGNCVRMIGDVSGIADGVFTQASYHAKWGQLAQYCADHHMWLYPCGGGGTDHGSLGTTPAGYSATAELIGDLGAYLQSNFKNIVGIDIENEAPINTADPVIMTRLADMTSRIRAKCSLPLTMSIVTFFSLPTPAVQAVLTPYFDFLDLHFYVVPSTANLVSVIYQSGQSPPWLRLPLMLGEYGVNVVGGGPGVSAPPGTEDAARRAMFNATLAQFAVQPWCMGALLWAMADQSTSSTDMWGIQSNAGVERAGAEIFRAMPTRRIPATSTLLFP